jgi:Flp pilus assembly protein TadD
MSRPRLVFLFLSLAVGATVSPGCASVKSVARKISPAAREEYDTKLTLAQVYEQEGNHRKAEGLYRELHERNPDDAQVCHHLGIVLTQLGREDEGILLIEQANLLNPDNPQIMNDLGYAYLLSGETDQAESILQSAHELDPDDRRTLSNLALAVGYNGRDNECLSLYRQVMSEAEAYANLGYVSVQRGDGPAALNYYSRALDLDPTLRPAAQALVQLADLRRQADTGTRATQQWAVRQSAAGRQPAPPRKLDSTTPQQIELTGGNFEWADANKLPPQ